MNIRTLVTKGEAVVIDVREPWEFEFGHAEGSINIPLSSIPYEVQELKAMGKTLILVCASGNRSGQAAAWLQSQGLTEAYNGGAWQNAA